MLDCRSKGPWFNPRPGHRNFLRVRDRYVALSSGPLQSLFVFGSGVKNGPAVGDPGIKNEIN